MKNELIKALHAAEDAAQAAADEDADIEDCCSRAEDAMRDALEIFEETYEKVKVVVV